MIVQITTFLFTHADRYSVDISFTVCFYGYGFLHRE